MKHMQIAQIEILKVNMIFTHNRAWKTSELLIIKLEALSPCFYCSQKKRNFLKESLNKIFLIFLYTV